MIGSMAEGATSSQPTVYRLGDITVADDLIITPNGNSPLTGSFWMVADHTRTVSVRPRWATVVAVATLPICLIGVPFWFIRTKRHEGNIEVRVEGESLKHFTQIPVEGHTHVALVRQLVDQLRFLAR